MPRQAPPRPRTIPRRANGPDATTQESARARSGYPGQSAQSKLQKALCQESKQNCQDSRVACLRQHQTRSDDTISTARALVKRCVNSMIVCAWGVRVEQCRCTMASDFRIPLRILPPAHYAPHTITPMLWAKVSHPNRLSGHMALYDFPLRI